MANHAVVRTDKMYGTDNRAGMFSAKYMVGTVPTDIDNGNVVLLDSLMTGEREIYKAVAPAANSPIAKVVLVAAPELPYDQRHKSLEDSYNEAGVAFRCYALHSGDIFSVTADALTNISASTAVGNVVELQANTKLKVVASATSGATKVGKLIEIADAGARKYYVIQVD